MEIENTKYGRIEDKIFDFTNKNNNKDWKTLLYELISKENLDPFDIDISIFTKKYLEFIKTSKTNFNISGKFLTIAVFLLKTKVDILVEREIKGLNAKFEYMLKDEQIEIEDLETLEDLENEIQETDKTIYNRRYNLKIRNPLARKRKVNIYDLISSLEKTFKQANKRRENFLIRNSDIEYTGPKYVKSKKNLKQIIEELYQLILEEFKHRDNLNFEHLLKYKKRTKKNILETFLPLLYLHNENKIEISQEEYFSEIKIRKVNKEVNIMK